MAQILANFHSDAGSDLGKPWAKEDAGNYETDSDSKKPSLAGSYESHSYVASLGVLPSIKQDVTSDAYLELGPQKTTRELLFKWMRRADIHLGKKTCSPLMKPFLSRDQEPGVNTIDLERTWDQLQEAARVIVGVECSGDILVASDSMMPECDVIQDFVQCTGISYYTGSCYTPGTLTAGRRPDLIILTYPKTEDHSRLFEDACHAGIPMIAFCETDTDIPKEYVDGTTIIPANCSKRALGWLFWFLTRMVLQVRGYRSEDDMWEGDNVPSLHNVPSMHRDGVSWEEWEEYCEERKKIDDENLDHIPIIHHVTPVECLGEWEQYERVSEECVRARVYSTSSMSPTYVLPDADVTCIDTSDTRLVTGHLNGSVKLWDVRRQKRPGIGRGHQKSVQAIAIEKHAKEYHVVSCSSDGQLRVWKTKEDKPLECISYLTHEPGITSLAINHVGNLVCGGSSEDARIWSLPNLGRVSRTLQGHTRGISYIEFSHSRDYVTISSKNDTVKVWDAIVDPKSPACKYRIKGHEQIITRASDIGGSDIQLILCDANVLKLWPAEKDGVRDREHGKEIQALAIGNNLIATVGFDARIIDIWRGENEV